MLVDDSVDLDPDCRLNPKGITDTKRKTGSHRGKRNSPVDR